METFSQIGQDLEVLQMYKYKKNGFFVEIGASDGITLSNTYLLEKNYDWKGICIEPIPSKNDQLIKNRPNSCIINKAVYKQSGLLIPFKISNINDLLSGICDYINCHIDVVNQDYNEILIETITLNDVLDNNNAPTFINYLSLDTEGTEFEILMSVDLNKYIFGLIDVEHNYVQPARDNIHKYLLSNGYIYKGENKFDDSYIHNSLLNKDDVYFVDKSKQIFTIVYKIYIIDFNELEKSLLSLIQYLNPEDIFEIILYCHDILRDDVFNLFEKLQVKYYFKYKIIPLHYNYNGYLKQMNALGECYNDCITDYVVFLDNYFILKEKLDLEKYIREDGKIEWIYVKKEDDPNNKIFHIWKKAVEDSTRAIQNNYYDKDFLIVTKKSLHEASNKFKELHNCNYDDYCQNRSSTAKISIEENLLEYNKITQVFNVIEYIGFCCQYFSNDYIFTSSK